MIISWNIIDNSITNKKAEIYNKIKYKIAEALMAMAWFCCFSKDILTGDGRRATLAC